MTNTLRMPFAKWLYLMSEAKLAPQARALAIYAVVFKITGNDDLARLSGMASKDKADKTFNHWKKHLHDHGWVLLGNRSGGRGRSLEVSPAYKETPVTFTDLCARDPSRFAAPELGVDNTPVSDPQTLVEKTRVSTSDAETSPPSREVKYTPVLAEREVEITPVLVGTGVEKTRVCPRARARIETPSGLLPYEDNNRNIRAISDATLPGFEEKPMPTNPRALGTSPRQSRSISETDIAFEQFWSLFPAERRRGKGKARGLFAAIVAGRHKIGRASADEMVQAVREWRGIDPNFPPMPETWLNQGRWMDDPKRSAPNHLNGSRSGLNGHIHEEVDYDALRRESGIVVYRGRDG